MRFINPVDHYSQIGRTFGALIFLILSVCAAAANQFGASNNGRAFLNLGSPDAGAYPFMNLVRAGLNETGTGAFPSQLNGGTSYPTGTLSQTISFTILSLPTTAETGGSWNPIMEWPKQGAVDQTATSSISRSGHTFTTVSQSSSCTITGSGTSTYTVAGLDCRVFYSDTGTGGLAYTISFPSGSTYTNFTNFIIVRSDQESELLAGSGTDCDSDSGICFYPDFLGTLSSKNWTAPSGTSGISLNPFGLRFLNWNLAVDQNATNNVTGWAQLQTVNALTWAAPFYFNNNEWAGSLCAQTQTGSCSGVGSGTTNQYGAAALGGVTTCASMGTTYHFHALAIDANTSAATLTVGTCTAPLVNINALALSSGNIAANVIQTVSYNPVLNEYIVQAQGTRAGVPVAVMIALANVLNMDPWINIPTMMDYVGTTSGVYQMVLYAGQHLKSGLTLHLEYSNEPFNPGAPPFHFFSAIGAVQGFPNNNNRIWIDPFTYQRQIAMQTAMAAWTAAGRQPAQLDQVDMWQSVAVESQVETYMFLGHDLTLDSSGNYTTGPAGGGCGGGAGSGLSIATNYSDTNNLACGVASAGYPAQTTINAGGYAPYWSGAQINYTSANCGSGINTFNCYQNDMTLALQAADNCGNTTLATSAPYCTGTAAQIAAAIQFVDHDIRAGTRDAGSGAVLGTQTLLAFEDTSLGGSNWFAVWDALAKKYSTTLGGSVGGTVTGIRLYEEAPEDLAPTSTALSNLQAGNTYTGSGACATTGGVINNAPGCAPEFANLINQWLVTLAAQFVVDTYNIFKQYPSSLSSAHFSQGPDTSQWSMMLPPDIYSGVRGTYIGFGQFSTLPH